MKLKILLFVLLLISTDIVVSQNYNNIVNYNFNATHQHGIKIKTNLPFANGSQMPVINIIGYNYNANSTTTATLNLQISWYIYNNIFYTPTMSSAGGSAPTVWLSNENGKVVIFLEQKVFYQRFTINAFAQGMSEKPEYFTGWIVQDEALGGSAQMKVPYKNIFGGNVGIGTESPRYELDVLGNIRGQNIILPQGFQITPFLGDNFTYQDKSFGHYASGWMSDKWNTSGVSLWQSGYGGIKFFTSGNYRMGITHSGNVGIGTEAPQNKLDVKGKIRAEEIIVETGWADFVFDKDYKLPSLTDVENHINEYKRLPDIPSESEVKEAGVGLGEMQVKLLQKIEELTLYVIEQNKKISDLETELSTLKTKID